MSAYACTDAARAQKHSAPATYTLQAPPADAALHLGSGPNPNPDSVPRYRSHAAATSRSPSHGPLSLAALLQRLPSSPPSGFWGPGWASPNPGSNGGLGAALAGGGAGAAAENWRRTM